MRHLNVLMLMMAAAVPAQALTTAELDTWIKGMPSIQTWLGNNEGRVPEVQPAPGTSLTEVYRQGVGQLKAAGLYEEFNSLVRGAGFNNAEHWASVTAEVSMAYMALEMEREEASVQELKAQLQQLQSMEGLPEAQRQAMVDMLQSSIAMVREVQSVPDADKNLVRARQQDIGRLMDEGAD